MGVDVPDNGPESLDRSSTAPLYVQVRDALRQQIDSHHIPPGAPLPTEDELQAAYGVSRSVVRQAMGDLVAAGLIHRQRGRGSVVAPQPVHRRRASQAGGLRQQLAQTGGVLRTEVVELRREVPPTSGREALGTSDAWYLERIRFVDDEPVVYMRTWIPCEPFPHLSVASLDGGSLHDWMRGAGAEPEGGPRNLQAVPADEVVAHHLAVEPGVAVLLMEGVTADAYDRGLEWFSAWHRPHTVFDVDASVFPARQVPHVSNEDLNRMRSLSDEMTALLNRFTSP